MGLIGPQGQKAASSSTVFHNYINCFGFLASFGQDGCVKGRKMGHITVTGFTPASALEQIRPVLKAA